MVLVTVQKTLLVPRVQCIDFPVVLQRQIPMTFCLSPEEYKVGFLWEHATVETCSYVSPGALRTFP